MYFDALFFTFQDLNCPCPFGIGVFFKLLEILVREGEKTHLPPNPNSDNAGAGRGGLFIMTMELVEWLPTARALENNCTSFINICKKALVSLDSCSSRWVMGNYLYKKNQWDNDVQPPEVIERC